MFQLSELAHAHVLETSEAVLTSNDFTAAQVDFVPLSLREVKLQKSDVAWSDIGGMCFKEQLSIQHINLFCQGLYETRRILRETLEWPTKYGPIFAQSPLRLRSGWAQANLQ